MTPFSARFDTAYRGLRYPVVSRYVTLRPTIKTNSPNLFLCKLDASVSPAVRAAILTHHVAHIHRPITQKQMLWVHASGVIALMQNLRADGDRADKQNPRHPMRSVSPPVADSKLPVRQMPWGCIHLPLPFVTARSRINANRGGKPLAKPCRVIAQKNIVEIHQAAPWLGARAGSSVATTLPPAFSNNPAALTQAA